MVRTIISTIIMLISALVGFNVGLSMDGTGTFGIIFAIIAGFACVIHAIESKKDN